MGIRIVKHASIGLALGALAVAFVSGCVVFQGPIKAKQIGDSNNVKVRFKLCNSDDQPGSECPDFGNSQNPGETGRDIHESVLLGFRVPKGTKLPKTIEPREDGVAGEFTRFGLYKALLNQEAPRNRRSKWIGYESSSVVDNTDFMGPGADPSRYDDASFKLKLKLPRGFDAKRFKFRPVVGWFIPNFPPDPPLVCGPALYDYVDDADGTRVCIDSPSPETVATSIKVKIKR